MHCLVQNLSQIITREGELVDGGTVARRRLVSREEALAVITGQVRRRLSIKATRANAMLILDRVQAMTSQVQGGD